MYITQIHLENASTFIKSKNAKYAIKQIITADQLFKLLPVIYRDLSFWCVRLLKYYGITYKVILLDLSLKIDKYKILLETSFKIFFLLVQ